MATVMLCRSNVCSGRKNTTTAAAAMWWERGASSRAQASDHSPAEALAAARHATALRWGEPKLSLAKQLLQLG